LFFFYRFGNTYNAGFIARFPVQCEDREFLKFYERRVKEKLEKYKATSVAAEDLGKGIKDLLGSFLIKSSKFRRGRKKQV
jgi:hypothetical protein